MKTLMTAAAMTLLAGTAMATETDNVIKHLDGGHTEVDHYIQYDEVEANNASIEAGANDGSDSTEPQNNGVWSYDNGPQAPIGGNDDGWGYSQEMTDADEGMSGDDHEPENHGEWRYDQNTFDGTKVEGQAHPENGYAGGMDDHQISEANEAVDGEGQLNSDNPDGDDFGSSEGDDVSDAQASDGDQFEDGVSNGVSPD